MNKKRKDFAAFLEENGYRQMKTDDPKGRMVLTRYYINPDGEVGYRCSNSEGFKKLGFVPDKDGYCRQEINVCGDKMMKFRHRLVAQNFISNPNNYPCINHIDRNIKNNSASNLEWVTVLQNAQHEKRTRNKKVLHPDYPILQLQKLSDTECEIIRRYNSRRDLPKYIDGNPHKVCKQYINAICRKFRYKHTFRGYMWVYEKDINTIPYKIINK